MKEPLKFFCEFRCKDDRKLFLKPRIRFASSGIIEFSDCTGLEVSGSFDFPMNGPDPLPFSGFKVSDTPEESEKYQDMSLRKSNTATIRYGDAWNKE
jgi:hypothetical protein